MSPKSTALVTAKSIQIHHQSKTVNAKHRNHNPNNITETNHFVKMSHDKKKPEHIISNTTALISNSEISSNSSSELSINNHYNNDSNNSNNSSPSSSLKCWQSKMGHFLGSFLVSTSTAFSSHSAQIRLSHRYASMSSSSIIFSLISSLSQSSILQLSHKFLLVVVAVLYIGTLEANCVRINSISQPQSFRNGLANSVILDCDFSVDENDDLLVVKWFHNDEPQHIYQWIQSRDLRIYSPKIKPYVDETFVVNDHPTRHRAIRLLNPPPSLSGKYSCSVSSLQNEDINSTYLIVYEPAQSFEIAAVEMDEVDYKQSDDIDLGHDDAGFNITCTAMGVYPEPEIKLYRIQSINDSLDAEEIKSSATSVLSFQSVSDGYYSITLTSHFEQNQTSQTNEEQQPSSEIVDDISPARERLALRKINKNKTKQQAVAEHYECRLTIPNSDYFEVKRLAIQDGWRTKYRFNGNNSFYNLSIQQVIFSMTMALATTMALFRIHL